MASAVYAYSQPAVGSMSTDGTSLNSTPRASRTARSVDGATNTAVACSFSAASTQETSPDPMPGMTSINRLYLGLRSAPMYNMITGLSLISYILIPIIPLYRLDLQQRNNMAPIAAPTLLTPALQYATAGMGLITLLFGLRAQMNPSTHFLGLGITVPPSPYSPYAARNPVLPGEMSVYAGAQAIGVRTIVIGALLMITAYKRDAEMAGWANLGMTAVMYVDGAATKRAVRMQREGRSGDKVQRGQEGRKGQKSELFGLEWLHWGSVPVFAGLAFMSLRIAYGL